MTYKERVKNSKLDYDIYINDKASDTDKDSKQEFVEKLKRYYDVVFCSPQDSIPSFDDYYLLPKLKDQFSTGYDVSTQKTTVLDKVKRVELGVKCHMPVYMSIEGKVRSSTFNKHEVMLSNNVMEIDSSFKGNFLAELIPLMFYMNQGKIRDNTVNGVPILYQFDHQNMSERIDYIQLKFIPVHTHLVSPPVDLKHLKIAGVVCQNIWDNFSTYFPSERGDGGFGSTDKKATINYNTGEMNIDIDMCTNKTIEF